MEETPKTINFIVVAIWILILLAIIFSLFDATRLPNLSLYVQFVTAVATIGTVYYAYHAVKLSTQATEDIRREREIELEYKKPEFQILINSLTRYKAGLDEELGNRFDFEVHAQQIGSHSATNVIATAYLAHYDLEKPPLTLKEENANDIPQLSSINIRKESLQDENESEVAGDFVYHIFEISYRDKITGRKYVQTIFKRLGWEDDSETWHYRDVGHEERTQLEQYMEKYRNQNS